jgi:hypothetical protein
MKFVASENARWITTMSAETMTRGNALDLLEQEDLELRRLFTQLRTMQGGSVAERAEYGDLVKTTIRHLATREAAITEVASVVTDTPELADVIVRIEADTGVRRPLINRVEKMSRGVPPMNLNQGQEFDEALRDIVQEVGTEIEWDLEVALPAMKAAIRGSDNSNELKSAAHVTRHAPTNLHPDGSRWFERAPVISRLLTIYDRMRDYPRADHGS